MENRPHNRIPPLTPERQARLARQLSQREVAQMLGVNRCYVSLFERGLLVLPETVVSRFWAICSGRSTTTGES